MITACPSCKSIELEILVNMGHQPMSHYTKETEEKKELIIKRCKKCSMIFNSSPIIGDFEEEYKFLSSTSTLIKNEAKKQSKEIIEHYIKIEKKFPKVLIEIASNDGYLLEEIKIKSPNTRLVGVDPSKLAFKIANKKGINQFQGYFNMENLDRIKDICGDKPDIIVANNVITHVPNLIEFFKTLSIMIGDHTKTCIRFQSTEQLLKQCHHECFYHENYNFPLVVNIEEIANKNGMEVYDGKKIEYHGGSIELWLKRKKAESTIISKEYQNIRKESQNTINNIENITSTFKKKKEKSIKAIEMFLMKAQAKGQKVGGYAAPQKAVTVLNSIKSENNNIKWIGDISKDKQGTFIAGTSIRIISLDDLINKKMDIIVVFAWNLYDEIKECLVSRGIDNKKIYNIKDIESMEL